ncbi:MAG: acyl-CoA synthetase [Proteobacteria bacterium]|nr:acyl-CoA synthetase [Pseudomonadota bacterium]MBU1451344.1 acyl-CoA synthetase [Pseudomonadota bacterium]MBU2469535.1 acyl-CoA synthetase [Pseudomonadota bacterium]MBU2518392.1 acyl-CoA synthetase [Pseudomonadota bacterium]
MLSREQTYEEIYGAFQWRIPAFFNMGVDVCDKWAGQRYRLALIFEDESGQVEKYTFWDLMRLSNRLANLLAAQGVKRGDRVGILLPQCVEAGLAHVAIYKLGAIAVPLFTLFGPEALEYRLGNSGARAIITDEANLPKVMEIKDALPELTTVVQARGKVPAGVVDFWAALDQASASFTPVETSAEDPALLIYTSGTTGPPKGALHAHRTLLGHLPGVQFPQNFFPQDDDLFWTPADWAWAGGLLDALLPSWHFGIPVLAHRARKFDPEKAFHLLAKYGVRNAFMPPTALKMMRQVPRPWERYDYAMRSIGSGGETLGAGLLDWGREAMKLTINEFYGMTECNLVLSNCAELMEVRPGSMGRPVPGHRVEVVDPEGRPLPPGEVGEVACLRPDPVMFLQYWQNPQATADKFIEDWCLFGDLAKKDAQGYFWFVGRKDDLITSSGYRIGPSEIEDCLIKHPGVALAAVIGAPDPVRGEVVKAFIVTKPGVAQDQALERDIQQFVKTRLAAHEYPRQMEFVSQLPMTATGKIKRNELRQRELARQGK